jgi:hypothetical protein
VNGDDDMENELIGKKEKLEDKNKQQQTNLPNDFELLLLVKQPKVMEFHILVVDLKDIVTWPCCCVMVGFDNHFLLLWNTKR